MKPVQPDAALTQVVGNKPIPRTEVTKKLWAYIKKNGLQDQKKRTNINADDKLKAVFGGKKTGHHVRDDQVGQQTRQVSIPYNSEARPRVLWCGRSWPFSFLKRSFFQPSLTRKRSFH